MVPRGLAYFQKIQFEDCLLSTGSGFLVKICRHVSASSSTSPHYPIRQYAYCAPVSYLSSPCLLSLFVSTTVAYICSDLQCVSLQRQFWQGNSAYQAVIVHLERSNCWDVLRRRQAAAELNRGGQRAAGQAWPTVFSQRLWLPELSPRRLLGWWAQRVWVCLS